MIYISPLILVLSYFLNFNTNIPNEYFKVKKDYCIEDFNQFLQNPEKQSVFSFITNLDSTTVINCLAYVPEDYNQNPQKKYPLLVFLHGGAEAGNDLDKVKRHGPPKLIEQGQSFPFIVISPQLPGKFTSKWPPELVNEVYKIAKKNFRVDENRFYLTGASVGGAGTWTYAITHPEKVAAIIPICGWGIPPKACNMKNVPTWAFHGAKDKVINVVDSRHMINALKNCGANPKFTVYPNAGHDSWTKTYNNPEIYKWLLAHNKKERNKKTAESKTVLKDEDPLNQKKNGLPQIKLQVLTSLPVSLKESSGIVVLDNSIWTHNDSGNAPVLFNIDSTGNIKQIKRITNATNFDWEDLTKDKRGNLYIGDFGNNDNVRKTLQIYKIPNPENIDKERIKAEVISFSFSDQKQFPPSSGNKNFDVEAMISFKDSLYLFSKNHTNPYSGYCKVYRLPSIPGDYQAILVDSIYLGKSIFESSVTSASISQDNKNLALLTYNQLFIFSCFKGSQFFSGNKAQFVFPFISQKEAIAFSDFNNNVLFITDEKSFNVIVGKLYITDIDPLISPLCPD